MSYEYITSSANDGTGTLRSCVGTSTSYETYSTVYIQPRTATSLFTVNLTDILSVYHYNVVIQGNGGRLVINNDSTDNKATCIYFGRKTSTYSVTFNNVDFKGLDGTKMYAAALSFEKASRCRITFNSCSFCGLKGLYAPLRFINNTINVYEGTVIFNDCVAYGNRSYDTNFASFLCFHSSSDFGSATFRNCTIGGNLTGSSPGQEAPMISNVVFPLNKINVVEGTEGWRVPPPSEYSYSTWTNTSYQSMDPRPSSTALWRTGAVTTDSTTDIAGENRKSNGALGAYEFFPYEQLATPTEFTANDINGTSLRLSWNAVPGASNYIITYNSTTHTTDSTSLDINGLNLNSTYTFSIVATSPDYIESSESTTTVRTLPYIKLSSPTGLTADQITSNSATISWNAVENASDYKVEYRVQGATNWTED